MSDFFHCDRCHCDLGQERFWVSSQGPYCQPCSRQVDSKASQDTVDTLHKTAKLEAALRDIQQLVKDYQKAGLVLVDIRRKCREALK